MRKRSQSSKFKSGLKTFFVTLVIGIGLGLLGSLALNLFDINLNHATLGVLMIVFGLSVILSLVIHVLIHELGHFIAGKIVGFDIYWFNIFGIMLYRKDDGFELTRYGNPFMLGYTLMTPKKDQAGKSDLIFYMLGGVISNLIFSALAFLISFMTSSNLLGFSLVIFAIIGLVFFVVNLLPHEGHDGSHVRKLLQSDDYVKELYKSLKCSEAIALSESFDDLHSFMALDSKLPLTSLTNYQALCLRANELSYQEEFQKALRIYQALYYRKDDLSPLQQMDIIYEYLYHLYLTFPQHKDIYRLKKEKLLQTYWDLDNALVIRVRTADAFYHRFDREAAEKLLKEGYARIAQSPSLLDRKLEYQHYDYLEKQLDTFDLDSIDLMPHDKLLLPEEEWQETQVDLGAMLYHESKDEEFIHSLQEESVVSTKLPKYSPKTIVHSIDDLTR